MKRVIKAALCVSLALLAGSSQIFAVSGKARMVLTGNFAEETKKDGAKAKYDFFTLGKKPQKDDDGIVLEISGDNFGGRLGLWYDVKDGIEENGSEVSFRRSNVWFKPIPQVKAIFGYVGNDQLYKERIDEWKVGNPFNIGDRDWVAHPGYVNCSDVDEMGFGLEVKPMEGLIFTAGIARPAGTAGDFGTAFWTSQDGESTFTAWGITGRYYWKKLCFQGSFRDNGSKSWKVARAAVGYEGNGFYAFAQPCLGIDWDPVEEKYNATGLCFDLYGEYKLGSWGFIGHVPVTVRFTKDEEDPNFMEYDFVVKYNFGTIGNMGDFSPNIRLGSMAHDGDNKYAQYRLSKQFADSVNFDITPGISFTAGACKFSTGFEMLIHSNLYMKNEDCVKFEWKVPFKAEVRF